MDHALKSFLPPPRSWFISKRPAGLILLLTVFLAYQPAWHAGYLWDDDALLTENPCIVGPLGIKEVWMTRAADICPLTITTLWAEHKLWGLAPLPYHLVNVLLHAIGALLLWRVLLVLQTPGAWLGAALWALHPVQVESVAWISEMKNTQSGAFYLLAILLFLRAHAPPNPGGQTTRFPLLALTWLSAAAAMTSKSSTMVLPVVLCLLAWWRDGCWRWRTLLELGPVFLLSTVAGVLSLWTQVIHPATGITHHLARGWSDRFVMAGSAVWFYLGKLVWPHPLITVYPRGQFDIVEWFASLALLVAVIALFVSLMRSRAPRPGWLVASAYFLVAIFPVLGFVEISFFRYSFVADHFLYLASMGPLALAGSSIMWAAHRFVPTRPWLPAAFAAGLLLMLWLVTWHRTWAYESQETLWTDTLSKNPSCWVGYGNLGVALAKDGQFAAAIDRYHEALQIGPNEAKTHNNLGSAFLHQGNTDEAIAEYQAAKRIDPSNAQACYNLGNVFLQEGQVDNAITQFQAATRLNSNYVAAYGNLGAAFKQKGQLDEAIGQYEKALCIDPRNVQNLNNLGNIFLLKGQADRANDQYQDALRVRPDDPYTYRNLGDIFLRKGRLDDAMTQYQEALKINPADAESHNNLGNIFLQKKQVDEAVIQYQEAVRLDSGYAAARRNLGLVLARKGRLDEAIIQFKEAIRLKPDFSEARQDLATAQTMIQRNTDGNSPR